MCRMNNAVDYKFFFFLSLIPASELQYNSIIYDSSVVGSELCTKFSTWPVASTSRSIVLLDTILLQLVN